MSAMHDSAGAKKKSTLLAVRGKNLQHNVFMLQCAKFYSHSVHLLPYMATVWQIINQVRVSPSQGGTCFARTTAIYIFCNVSAHFDIFLIFLKVSCFLFGTVVLRHVTVTALWEQKRVSQVVGQKKWKEMLLLNSVHVCFVSVFSHKVYHENMVWIMVRSPSVVDIPVPVREGSGAGVSEIPAKGYPPLRVI